MIIICSSAIYRVDPLRDDSETFKPMHSTRNHETSKLLSFSPLLSRENDTSKIIHRVTCPDSPLHQERAPSTARSLRYLNNVDPYSDTEDELSDYDEGNYFRNSKQVIKLFHYLDNYNQSTSYTYYGYYYNYIFKYIISYDKL